MGVICVTLSCRNWCVCAQVPWGMVTGPDDNLYIAMDDEYEVPPLTITGPCIAQVCRACAGRMCLGLCATSTCMPGGLRKFAPNA